MPDAVSEDGSHLLCDCGAHRLAGGEVLPATVCAPGGLYADGVPAGAGDRGGALRRRGALSLPQDRQDESGSDVEE